MDTNLKREATSDEISKDRLLLGNPYAHLDEYGSYSALKKNVAEGASLNELRISRLILQNPYAHQQGDGTFDAIGQKKARYSNKDIEKKVAAIHKLIWRNRHKIWLSPPSNPIELLDPVKAIETLSYSVSLEAMLGEMRVGGKTIEAAGIIDNDSRKIRLSRNHRPEVQRFTAAHELGHILMHEQTGLHRDRPIDGMIKTREPAEYQADVFASLFLMPKKLVSEKFKQIYLTDSFELTNLTISNFSAKHQKLLSNCKSLREVSKILASCEYYRGLHFYSLASQFKVSIEAMAIRLEELELISSSLFLS
jgi:Zn-dependent peptidase ImmA (M78 family)